MDIIESLFLTLSASIASFILATLVCCRSIREYFTNNIQKMEKIYK